MENEYLLYANKGEYIYMSVPFTKIMFEKGKYRGYNTTIDISNKKLILNTNNQSIYVSFNCKNEIKYIPTFNGLMCEINASNIKGIINYNSKLFLRCNNRFLALMESNILPVLIINPYYGISDNHQNKIDIEYKVLNETTIEFELKSVNCQKLLFEISGYSQKLVFDNIIEKDRPDRNNVYSSIAFLNDTFEEEQLMIRFNYIKMCELLDKEIIDAFLYIRIAACDKKALLKVAEIENSWCSIGTTWQNKPKSSFASSFARIKNNCLIIDIKKYISLFSKKENVNHPGFLIKSINKQVNLITADSYLYPQIIKIKTKEKKI